MYVFTVFIPITLSSPHLAHPFFLASPPSVFEYFYLDVVSSLLWAYEYTMLGGRQQTLTLIALYYLTLSWHRCSIYGWTCNNHLFAEFWPVIVLCGYSDLLQKEVVSLINAERASQIHRYKRVCKAISSRHLDGTRKTTAAASSVRHRTRFTLHSQTLILSLGSLLTSNQKGLSYSIACIHYYTREHTTLG